MKQRNVIAVVCFSIITLGIYDLFWLVSTKKELNMRTKQHVPSVWLLFIPAIVVVATAIIDGIVAYSQSNSGSTGSVMGVIMAIIMGIVIVFAAIVVPVYWFLKYSKAVHEYTNGELSTAVTFMLLWILRFVGIAVIQDKFNDMVITGASSAMPANIPTSMAPQTPDTTPAPIVTPAAPVMGTEQSPMPTNEPAVPSSEQAPMPQQPPATIQPQSPVDPTKPETYDQQSQVPPSTQPPVPPPAGPVVQ